ncbi:hypothetical protein TNCV_3608171 [Trichonephila clavipes]|nr:hypothetical protein TNCV_3608171 [Trichonephila clavipes]
MSYEVRLKRTLLYNPLAEVQVERIVCRIQNLYSLGVLGLRTALRQPVSCLVTWNESISVVDDVTAEKFSDPLFVAQEAARHTFLVQH